MINYQRQRNVAHDMIRKYGAPAILRRSGGLGDRGCWVFISDYSPSEKRGQLINETDRRALVSPVGLTDAPDSEQDRLVTLDPATGAEAEILRIVSPIGKLAPGGIVVYWELQIRR